MNIERVLISAIAAATLLMFLGPKAIAWLRANEVGQFVRPEARALDGIRLNFFAEEIVAPVEEEEEALAGEQMTLGFGAEDEEGDEV